MTLMNSRRESSIWVVGLSKKKDKLFPHRESVYLFITLRYKGDRSNLEIKTDHWH